MMLCNRFSYQLISIWSPRTGEHINKKNIEANRQQCFQKVFTPLAFFHILLLQSGIQMDLIVHFWSTIYTKYSNVEEI
jgi:hypothetical protein